LQAARLVREGISVSLAHTLDKEVMVDNPTPFKQEFFMGADGKIRPTAVLDIITSAYHATTTTHLDSLCHYIFEGKPRRSNRQSVAARFQNIMCS